MSKLTDRLNVFLADQTVLFTKLHNLHWYVKGKGFFTLHAEYEKLYDQASEVLDEVAERLLMLGESPVASLKEVLKLATIKEREASAVGSRESVQILLEDVEKLIGDTKEIVGLAADGGDEGTADQFTGYLRAYQKLAWMLRVYLKD